MPQQLKTFETIDVKPALQRLRFVRETMCMFLNMTPGRRALRVSTKPVSLLPRRTPGDDGAVGRWTPYFGFKPREYSDWELFLVMGRQMCIVASLLICLQAKNKKEGRVSWSLIFLCGFAVISSFLYELTSSLLSPSSFKINGQQNRNSS